MEKIVLKRTGLRPVEFQGELISEATTKEDEGSQKNRWHEIKLFKHEDGRFILHVAWRTQWQGEPEFEEIFDCKTGEEVQATLSQIDPVAHLVGFPPGKKFEEKQIRLIQIVKTTFKIATSEVLEGIGAEKI